MREVEVKAVVDSMPVRIANVEHGGGRLVFRGRLEDSRYDTADHRLRMRDDVLRLRIYRDERGTRAELGWKGPTHVENGYKVRDEVAAASPDAAALHQILERLGFVITREIHRDITQYELDGAVVRFERYPRMDDLVEVEGTPNAIEQAISVIGLPRDAFTSERLFEFVRRWEARTGEIAALSDRELRGERPYALEDA
jgi:predicted adenylyl cyclase CyaB